jgi:hypothetical protein
MFVKIILAVIALALGLTIKYVLKRRSSWWILGSVLLALLVFLKDDLLVHLKAIKVEKQTTMTGSINSGSTADSDSISVVMGSVTLNLIGDAFTNGRPVMPLRRLTNIMNYPFVLRMTDKGLLLNTKFRSFDDKLVAELIDNEWVVYQGSFLSRNYDETAVEVIDEYGFPVVQVEVIDGWILRLGGYLFERDQMYIFADGVHINARPRSPDELVKMLEGAGLKSWFVYPSNTHLGERVKQ